MDTTKIGQLISNLRKKNNLTQQAFANQLGVTYQAVSKWENGKSIPDIAILQEISRQFNISIDELLMGEKKQKNNIIKVLIILFITLIVIIGIIVLVNKDDFEFRGLYTNHDEFSINGVMAFTKDKSSIYISNINYNKKDNSEYKVLECNLYQKNKNVETKISTCGNLNDSNTDMTTLNDLLKSVSFKIDNYNNNCKDLKKNNLYLEINAKNKNNQIITYEIPLKLDESCN